MFDFLSNILQRIDVHHLNILFLLGFALFAGTVGGRLFQKFKIPQVVGYIVIGISIGEAALKIVGTEVIQTLQPFNYFALGLIGFMVGGELSKDIFAKYGKQLITILLCEGIAPFILVSVLVGVIGTFLLGDWRLAWALSFLLGSVASATDPASTTEVFREYKTKGPVTTTLTGIVALDDALALLLFTLASSIAGTLKGNNQAVGLLASFIRPAYEIVGSIAVGAMVGYALNYILKKYSDESRLLAFSIGAILLATGLSLALHLELLLTLMTTGMIVVNLNPRKSKILFDLIGGFTPPIYILFFVLIGAKLNLANLKFATIIFVLIYLFGTMFGKVAGSYFGAIICAAPKAVRRCLPWGLFSQAGVAIGLSILAAQYFPGDIGNNLVIIITATTFILQLFGPPFTKLAVKNAGEIGLDITEEDIIRSSQAKDLMDKDFPVILKSTPLPKILEIFSNSNNLYYPVVDNSKRLIGIITIDNIKSSFLEATLSNFLLADDLTEPVIAMVGPETPILEVKELLSAHNLEYLPVVNKDGLLNGFIEKRNLDRLISTKIMELQKKADSLG